MSFILDALRKSDARRQQGGPPGLNSPEPPRPPRRRRRRLLPLLAAVLVVFAVTATAVYIVRPDWLPQGLAGGEVADVSAEQAASPQPVADADGRQREERPATEEPEASGRPAAPTRPPAAQDSASAQEAEKQQEAQRDRRRPIPASPERTVRREAPQRERESEPVPADDAMEELERRLAEQVRQQTESPEPSTDQPEESRPPADREPERQPERKRAAEPKPLNEGVAEYLRQWELPLSVRRNLPELNLTIHVFSPAEAERFVLINGERYVPGDAIGEAQIVDISRDGAIVDFRSHRFLLEPR